MSKAPLPPGRFHFNVVCEIGRGGLGIVDEIVVTESNSSHPVGRRLARKRLGPQWAAHPQARERFEREIWTLRDMNHPNIITVQGEDIGAGDRFYCMPKCAKSYRTIIQTNPNGFQWQSVARFGLVIAGALGHAHALGHIHRDVKPENILLDEAQNIYVADWGVGYFIHQHSKVLTKLTQFGGLGTEYYCSIEQWAGSAATAQMDVYALGMLLAELTMGRQIRPFVPGCGVQMDVTHAGTNGAARFNKTVREMTAMLAAHRLGTMDDVIAALNVALTFEAW